MKILDIFAGIGGFSLAGHLAGHNTVMFCEINEFCQKVLKKNLPGIHIYSDITTLTSKDILQYGKPEEFILCGGFPCQPFSQAGKRKGDKDERALFPELFRIIQEVRPKYCILENVSGIINIQNGEYFEHEVISRLESINYEVQPFSIPASAEGAWHKRERVWFIAHDTNCDQYRTIGDSVRKEVCLSEKYWEEICSRWVSGADYDRNSTCNGDTEEQKISSKGKWNNESTDTIRNDSDDGNWRSDNASNTGYRNESGEAKYAKSKETNIEQTTIEFERSIGCDGIWTSSNSDIRESNSRNESESVETSFVKFSTENSDVANSRCIRSQEHEEQTTRIEQCNATNDSDSDHSGSRASEYDINGDWQEGIDIGRYSLDEFSRYCKTHFDWDWEFHWYEIATTFCRMADGISDWLDRSFIMYDIIYTDGITKDHLIYMYRLLYDMDIKISDKSLKSIILEIIYKAINATADGNGKYPSKDVSIEYFNKLRKNKNVIIILNELKKQDANSNIDLDIKEQIILNAMSLINIYDGYIKLKTGYTTSANRVERLKSLGNAIVPRVAYRLFETINETEYCITNNISLVDKRTPLNKFF